MLEYSRAYFLNFGGFSGMSWTQLEHIALPIILGAFVTFSGVALRFMHSMSLSLSSIAEKLSVAKESLEDHEQRLRVIELKKARS